MELEDWDPSLRNMALAILLVIGPLIFGLILTIVYVFQVLDRPTFGIYIILVVFAAGGFSGSWLAGYHSPGSWFIWSILLGIPLLFATFLSGGVLAEFIYAAAALVIVVAACLLGGHLGRKKRLSHNK